jgi:hypothetical protein
VLFVANLRKARILIVSTVVFQSWVIFDLYKQHERILLQMDRVQCALHAQHLSGPEHGSSDLMPAGQCGSHPEAGLIHTSTTAR